MDKAYYTKLDVWQKSMDLIVVIYELTKRFPKDEIYSLTSQMRRASISIASNIAEGRSRRTTKEFMRFISIASGLAAEMETQLMLAGRLNYSPAMQVETHLQATGQIVRMLNGLYTSLENKLHPSGIAPQPPASNPSFS